MPFHPPILPRIESVDIAGFFPIFKEDLKIGINHQILLILGGNGLGKTTILQSIVYCIAGEADLKIEVENKNRRWSRKYFIERLSDPYNASVKVEFHLQNWLVGLRRGFRTAKLQEFWLNDELVAEDNNAATAFAKFIVDEVGYRSVDDFRFLVHKLCYLPEDRTNIVWDSETQIRLLMLLFTDIADESYFRARRKLLKELDSERRHINVAKNKVTDELNAQSEFDEEQKSSFSDTNNTSVEHVTDTTTVTSLLQQLNQIASERIPLQARFKDLKGKLSQVTVEVEEIEAELTKNEESFILDQLSRFESEEVKLALHKLLHRHMCPACGSDAQHLSQQAQEYVRTARCPLCGTQQSSLSLDSLPVLDAQLSEKLRNKSKLEQEIYKLY